MHHHWCALSCCCYPFLLFPCFVSTCSDHFCQLYTYHWCVLLLLSIIVFFFLISFQPVLRATSVQFYWKCEQEEFVHDVHINSPSPFPLCQGVCKIVPRFLVFRTWDAGCVEAFMLFELNCRIDWFLPHSFNNERMSIEIAFVIGNHLHSLVDALLYVFFILFFVSRFFDGFF